MSSYYQQFPLYDPRILTPIEWEQDDMDDEYAWELEIRTDPDEPINYAAEPWDCQPTVDGYSRQDGDIR